MLPDIFKLNINSDKASAPLRTFFAALILLFTSPSLFGQWVNNPALNTKLIVDAVNPVNVSAVSDQKGGSFIFWQDNRNEFQSNIYFLHVDANGSPGFRSDGKAVSNIAGDKDNPIAVPGGANNAVVVWRELKGGEGRNLYAQKVNSNGTLSWTGKGIKLTSLKYIVTDFSVDTDKRGFIYTGYVTKDPQLTGGYKIGYQKLSPSGRLMIDSSLSNIYGSGVNKTGISAINDGSGGAYLLWIENLDKGSVIFGQHLDSTGRATWGKKPLTITETSSTIISFSAAQLDLNNVYIAYQTLKGGKKLRHQLLTKRGRLLWGASGKQVSKLKSVQTNPQVITFNKEIILSWTNELEGDRDIFIQKYSAEGTPVWPADGISVTKFEGHQFGQKLISDGSGGAIVTWIDRRVKNSRADLYGQRINSKGKKVWENSGLPIASYKNTEKSYPSLISDNKGGAVVIFRERRENQPAIYAQKIFNSGTYISQILGFKTESAGDSVKLFWYSANVTDDSYYEIERIVSADTGFASWQVIGTVNPREARTAVLSEYTDYPDTTGTLYYRIVQKDGSGNIQTSDVERVTFIGRSPQTMVAQNTPNPFSKETTIKFYLQQSALVNIEFFNNQVEKVHEIKNAEYPAGENEIAFNANGLKPGIYFYRFKCGDYVEVKKMVITE